MYSCGLEFIPAPLPNLTFAVRLNALKTKKPESFDSGFSDMARVEGFEPPTAWFVARYSIQLSYTRFKTCSFFEMHEHLFSPVNTST